MSRCCFIVAITTSWHVLMLPQLRSTNKEWGPLSRFCLYQSLYTAPKWWVNGEKTWIFSNKRGSNGTNIHASSYVYFSTQHRQFIYHRKIVIQLNVNTQYQALVKIMVIFLLLNNEENQNYELQIVHQGSRRRKVFPNFFLKFSTRNVLLITRLFIIILTWKHEMKQLFIKYNLYPQIVIFLVLDNESHNYKILGL